MIPQPEAQAPSRPASTTLQIRRHWPQILLLAICIGRFWLTPLPSSFWTDETGTFFVIERPSDPSIAVVPQVPASIYFNLLRPAVRLLGSSEISYRIPSVLLMAIALFVIGRLAARLIHPGAAWFAVFACFAMPNFSYFAADARPYALGICVTVACLHFLIDWLDTARWKPALLFVLFGALLWRVQLVFWAFYPVFIFYTLLRIFRAGAKVSWLAALSVYGLLSVTLIPVALESLSILKNAHAHVFAPMPGLRASLLLFPWIPFALCAALPWLGSRLLKWRPPEPATPEALTLIAVSWIWMPLCLFAWSHLTGTVLFVPRYFSPALPGMALTATALAAFYLPRQFWKPATIVLAALTLLWFGQWNVLWIHHAFDNWRDGALEADLEALDPDTPVVTVSPFVEAQPPAWTPDYPLPGFLYAPLLPYPVHGKIYPFPFLVSPVAEQYADTLLRDTLLKQPRFIVYGGGRNALNWADWFSKRPELARWSYSLNTVEAIVVIVFHNPSGT
jgi:hypothetical protein